MKEIHRNMESNTSDHYPIKLKTPVNCRSKNQEEKAPLKLKKFKWDKIDSAMYENEIGKILYDLSLCVHTLNILKHIP